MNSGQLFGILSCKRLSYQPNRGLGSRFACVCLLQFLLYVYLLMMF